MDINLVGSKQGESPELTRNQVLELINRQSESSRSELVNALDSGKEPANLDELKPIVRGLVNTPNQEKNIVEQSSSNNHQTLPQSVQQQNARRDDTISPYLGDAASKMSAASQALSEAHQAVERLYVHSDPKQQKALEEVQQQLHQTRSGLSGTRKALVEAKPDYNATLAKNGQSQFNAAARGDPRSLEPQIANQNRPAQKPEVVTISASPSEAKDTPLERKRGEAKQGFNQAADAKPEVKQNPAVESEQVKNAKPEPHLRPSPELGSGADRTVHLQAKGKDNQASREVSKQAGTQKEKPSPELQAHYEKIAAKMHEQPSQSQAQGQNLGTSQGMGR